MDSEDNWELKSSSSTNNEISLADLEISANLLTQSHDYTDLFYVTSLYKKAKSFCQNLKQEENKTQGTSSYNLTNGHLRSTMLEFLSCIDLCALSLENFMDYSSMFPIFTEEESDVIQLKITGRELLKNNCLANNYHCIANFANSKNFTSLTHDNQKLLSHLQNSEPCKKFFEENFHEVLI